MFIRDRKFEFGVLDTTLCDKDCQWLAAGQWFSSGTPVSSITKIDCYDITEILLKVALNTITLTFKFCNINEPEWQINLSIILAEIAHEK